MAMPQISSRGLDFFANCEMACQRICEHVMASTGETPMRSLQVQVLRDLMLLHNLPLQTLNDRLKRYPFVDPTPFDEHLTGMMDAILEWLQWVTRPDWIVDVLNQIGALTPKGKLTLARRAHEALHHHKGHSMQQQGDPLQPKSHRVADHAFDEPMENELELEHLGRFIYPIPLKLRDLQAMIRPFMEVRSSHHIVGLDAVVAELVRLLLSLYQTIKAWDDALMEHISNIAKAQAADDALERPQTLLELCATAEMDVFESAHRLHRIDPKVFVLPAHEIETICQQLPLYEDQRVLYGHPTSAREHGQSAELSPATVQARANRPSGLRNVGEDADLSRVWALPKALEAVRNEALVWWHEQHFSHGVPTRTLANALLSHLVDLKLHPDPFVAEMLPRVLERLCGVQVSVDCWMNKLLPRLGGYVDSTGVEVGIGAGLPLLTNPALCAETMLTFLRHWCDLVRAAEDEDGAKARKGHEKRDSRKARGSDFKLGAFLSDAFATGHNVDDVVDLLEGVKPVPEHVLKVPVEEKRYRIDGEIMRRWELATEQMWDHVDLTESHQRDLGPYVHLRLDDPQEVEQVWSKQPQSWCLVNPVVMKAASKRYQLQEDDEEEGTEYHAWDPNVDVSNTLALRLVEYPQELGGKDSPSTFVRFFSEDGRKVSRNCLQGLPPLPWCFGTDDRNTIIVDLPLAGIAPFHCIFTKCRYQPHRPCIMQLGDPLSRTYIIAPKYQPLPVRNGDRLICHEWNFQLRIKPTSTMRHSSLQILTDEGSCFEVPMDGCHVGGGNRSRPLAHQPDFPPTKFTLKHRLRDMAAVHIVFHYQREMDRWTLVDHSPHPLGCLLVLKQGVAYPLSEGLRVKMGPVILEVAPDAAVA